jgi:hypothetical protein
VEGMAGHNLLEMRIRERSLTVRLSYRSCKRWTGVIDVD